MLLRSCVCVIAAISLAFTQAPRQTVSLILTGGIVVTMDPAGRVLTPGAVAIDGRDIVAIDTAAAIAARYESRESIDTTGQVVMPGLINTHTHAPMVLYRGLADDLALMDWLQKYIFPAEAKTVTPEFVRAGTRLAALEMIQSGTTTYADMYYFEEEIATVTREAGLRGVLGQTIIQFPVADAKTPAEGLARTEKFIKQFAGDDLIVPAVAPHSMYTLDSKTLKAARALADREHVPVLIHLSETSDEVKTSRTTHKATPVAYLESARILGTQDAGGARRLADARRHDDPGAPARRRVAQSRKQHEAGERHGEGHSDAHGRPGRGARHRRCGKQQRPRHVRGDAAGGVPGKAADQRPSRSSRSRRAGDGDDRWRPRARHGAGDRLARGRQARRHDYRCR